MAARKEPKATIRIIDHKKVLLTPDEFRYYEEICEGYNRPNFSGQDLFQDHFETNDDGVIVFVKPPHKKYSSMEVFTFLISLQVNQQLRLAQAQVQSLVIEADKKFKEKLDEVGKLKWEIEEINELKDQLKVIDKMQKDWESLKEEVVERSKEKVVKANSKKGRKTNDGTTN